MSENPVGQPPKILDESVRKRILFALSKGASYKIACGFAGIATTTYYRWVELGSSIHDMDPEYRKDHRHIEYYNFWRDVEAVKADAALKWLERIDDAAKFHWQAAAWKLERRYPDEYGRSDKPQGQDAESEAIKKAKDEVDRLKGDDHGRSPPAKD
jgi:transposase